MKEIFEWKSMIEHSSEQFFMKKYDYLIVGAGLFGAVFAQQAKACGKKVLVIDKRPNIAGNA